MAFFLMFCCLTGCTPRVLHTDRYLWPPPPDQPRIEWLAAYHSHLDLEKTTFRRIKEALAGEDAPIALKKPIDVKADSVRNKIYVADLLVAGVFVFDVLESELRMIKVPASEAPVTIQPVSIALDRKLNLYVLDAGAKRILVFDAEENFLRTINVDGICPRPIALAIDNERERIYVADAQESRIVALSAEGNQLFSIGGPGDATGLFNRPVGMAVNSNGELIVADAFNARVQIFDENGKFLRNFGRRGTNPGDFQLIKSVAVDPDDNIHVVDGRSNSLSVFSQAGVLLLNFGTYYAVSSSGKIAPGGFALPVAIDIDDLGKMYVVDQLNARVQVFQYLSENSRPTKVK